MVQVHAPAPKVYEILAQGVADAVLMTMEVKTSFKLAEVTPHTLVVPGGIYYGTFFTAMNPDKFKKLAKQDQDAVMRVSGEALANLTGKAWSEADDAAVGEAKAAGNTITTANPAFAQAIKARLAGIENDWIERARKKGMANAKDVLAELRAEVAKVKKEKR
jgi:TRAP-type C4-dicarboxylate transport system substrate-binding protein